MIREHAQREPPTQPAREAWLVIGRRGGKSRTTAALAVYLAVARDYSKLLAVGEIGTLMLLAADRKQARVLRRYIGGIFKANPELDALIESETADAVELSTRVSIEIHTASHRTTRGYTLIGALLDECAFWHSDEGGASPDTEILNAIRPATATIPGALIVGLSSPYRRHGILWNAFNRYFGKPGDVFVWNASTLIMNPRVPMAIIEQAYREDDAAASAEYGACFRRDLERYISQEAVAAVTVPGRLFNEPADGVTYAAFVDPSGGSQDSMTLGIAHKDGRGRAVLDLVLERRAPFNPDAVTDEFCRGAPAVQRARGGRRSLCGPLAACPV